MLKKEKDYKGKIWCPYVENHTWIARKDDYIFITGNSFPRREVEYPIITVTSTNVVDQKLGQQSEKALVDFSVEVRIWARNEKEKNNLFDEVYTHMRTNQYGTDGTVEASLIDFGLDSAVDIDEVGENATKSKICTYHYRFIA